MRHSIANKTPAFKHKIALLACSLRIEAAIDSAAFGPVNLIRPQILASSHGRIAVEDATCSIKLHKHGALFGAASPKG